jgi:hypothetical protein
VDSQVDGSEGIVTGQGQMSESVAKGTKLCVIKLYRQLISKSVEVTDVDNKQCEIAVDCHIESDNESPIVDNGTDVNDVELTCTSYSQPEDHDYFCNTVSRLEQMTSSQYSGESDIFEEQLCEQLELLTKRKEALRQQLADIDAEQQRCLSELQRRRDKICETPETEDVSEEKITEQLARVCSSAEDVDDNTEGTDTNVELMVAEASDVEEDDAAVVEDVIQGESTHLDAEAVVDSVQTPTTKLSQLSRLFL